MNDLTNKRGHCNLYYILKEDKENHGIGTSLLSEIAKKYDGEFHTEQKENKFIAVVSMKNQ